MDKQSVCASGYTDYKARLKKKDGGGGLYQNIYFITFPYAITFCLHSLLNIALQDLVTFSPLCGGL